MKFWQLRTSQPPSTNADNPENGSSFRRAFLRGAFALLLGAFIPSKSKSAPNPSTPSAQTLQTEGEVLKTTVSQGIPPIEPLDTMIRFERSDDNSGRAMTHEILSLIHEEKGPNSYPWTIYSHLTSNHVQGDACVLCSRLTKNNRGWSAGLHSEVFSHAPMVALGVNIEMSNLYEGTEQTVVIGVNIQAHGVKPCQYGIQIQDADSRFEKGIGLNGKGDVGLDMAGKYGVGIDAHDNSIRLNEGAAIELDGVGKVKLRYNQGRIEFMNGDRCIGHINADGQDHEL